MCIRDRQKRAPQVTADTAHRNGTKEVQSQLADSTAYRIQQLTADAAHRAGYCLKATTKRRTHPILQIVARRSSPQVQLTAMGEALFFHRVFQDSWTTLVPEGAYTLTSAPYKPQLTECAAY